MSGQEQSITAGEISRNFGLWQDRALTSPVVVTNHGRPRVVLISAEQYSAWNEAGAVAAAPRESVFESSLAAVLDHVTEGFIAFDSRLHVVAVNHQLETLAVRSASQLVGRFWEDLFPTLARSVVGEQLKRVLRTGEPAEFEAVTEGPVQRRYAIRAFPYPYGVATLIRNRTAELEMAAQVQEARSLAAALTALPQMMVVNLNVRGVIRNLDASFAQLTGFTEEELRNSRLTDIVAPRERAAVAAALEAVLQGGAPRRISLTILQKNGGEQLLDVGLSTIHRDLLPDGVLAALMLP